MSEDFHEFSREAEEERLQQHFRDFLIAPEIAGSSRTFSTSRRIPAERITDSGDVVEVSQEVHEEEGHGESTVLVHRNDFNEITCIEIVCACGRNTMIRLEEEAPQGDDPAGRNTFEGRQPGQNQV